MPIGAALSAIGGLVGGLASAGANLYMNKRNNQANAAQARLQNQWNIEQWNRENEYNLPVNQVQRMKDAGINPGLYYGQNQMMNEAAASPEMTSAAGQLRAGYIDPMMLANIGLINAQKEKTETETDEIVNTLPQKLKESEQRIKESNARIDELNQSVLNLQEQLKNLTAERKLTVEKTISESFERTMRSEEFDLNSQKVMTECNKLVQDILESKSRVKFNAASESDLRAATELKKQDYEFLMLYNVERLTGVKLDNELKEKTKSLYDDQHILNQLQSQLLGFNVTHQGIQFERDSRWLSALSGDNGKARMHVVNAIDALISGAQQLISPLNGILSIGVK